MFRLFVIGAGPVGLVTAAGLAHWGHRVTCVEKESSYLSALSNGTLHFFEPGLSELVHIQSYSNRLDFANSVAFDELDGAIVFICTGSPATANGRLDVSSVRHAILELLGARYAPAAIIIRSTVPVGTTAAIQHEVRQTLGSKCAPALVYNPEFLRSGCAVQDFLNPSRIVIGTHDQGAVELLRKVYEPGLTSTMPIVVTTSKSAELIKQASNAFIAIELSFINELVDLCGSINVRYADVITAMGMDPRIGIGGFRPGPGWGGPCLEKDASELVQFAKKHNVHLSIINSALNSNSARIESTSERIAAMFTDITKCRIGVFGLTFKSNTSDTRNSPAIAIANHLSVMGAEVLAYDPIAKNLDKNIRKQIRIIDSPYRAACKSDCLLVLTECYKFRELDFGRMAEKMRGKIVVDLQSQLDSSAMKNLGFEYFDLDSLPLLSPRNPIDKTYAL